VAESESVIVTESESESESEPESEPVTEAEPESEPVTESESASPRAVVDPDAALRREIAQLERLRGLVERSPRRAYRLALSGHREFGEGMLYEEREALAIMALQRSGRDERAAGRLRAFESRFPRSPLLPRLRAGSEEKAP
jgi:hypothetical protein